MRRVVAVVILSCTFAFGLSGQSVTTVDKAKFAEAASARYYSLVHQGLVSFSCDVKVNWDTVPKMILIPAETAEPKGLEAVRVKASQGIRTPAKVEREYSQETSALAKVAYDPLFSWLSEVVRGFMMTWGAKGMDGPIPYEDGISTVTLAPSGYRVVLVHPNVQLLVGKDYLITEVLTSGDGQDIDEHLLFAPSEQGLLYTGSEAVNKLGGDWNRIQYNLDYQPVETLQLPHNVHLIVDNNIDMKFSFESCSVVRGTMIQVSAPPAK